MEYTVVQLLERANQTVFNPAETEQDIEREKASRERVTQMQTTARDIIKDEGLLKDLQANLETGAHLSEKYLDLLHQIHEEKKRCNQAIQNIIDSRESRTGESSAGHEPSR